MERKKVTRDIEHLLNMLRDLNELGALDGLIFAAVRSSGEAPVYGRVCDGHRDFELLGALHAASFALCDKIDGVATVVDDGSKEEP